MTPHAFCGRDHHGDGDGSLCCRDYIVAIVLTISAKRKHFVGGTLRSLVTCRDDVGSREQTRYGWELLRGEILKSLASWPDLGRTCVVNESPENFGSGSLVSLWSAYRTSVRPNGGPLEVPEMFCPSMPPRYLFYVALTRRNMGDHRPQRQVQESKHQHHRRGRFVTRCRLW